ncbi:MAG: hypothetical protein HKN68_00860 [Saprospiraceae bacterium]|nr:hypothetical protein [Saprospiraceae bacterium]
MLYSVLLVFIGLLAPSGVFHDIHISKCDIKHDTEDRALQITLHIFIDDLEKSLEEQGEEGLFILTEQERVDVDSLMEEYINEHLRITVDGQEVLPYYLGKEISDDLMAAWCYLEVPEVDDVSEIEVIYDVLMELYNDQRNIVTVKQDRDRKAYLLFDIKERQAVVEF